ncbi:IS30 family transposase, partial [Promicromonospora alba]
MRWPVAARRRVVGLIASGWSQQQAAACEGVSRLAAARWWSQAGGMKLVMGRGGGPARPARGGRARGPGHRLTLEDRDEIQRGLDAGLEQVEIARRIGRSPSTVSREIGRHRSPGGDYSALVADSRALQQAMRPKKFKLADPGLSDRVTEWMDQGWSPGLIASILRRDNPEDRSQWVSHETIYKSLYVQARGRLRADLHQQLSTHRSTRKSRERVGAGKGGWAFKDALKISQRPPEVADRAVPGHWEGDLILGTGGTSAIGTLVERTTRYTILLHLPGDHTAATVAGAMITAMSDLPAHLRRSLTWDRGSELADYVDIQLDLRMPVYFADPHSPWQRGSNENTNRLLRHWFEKGTDLSGWTPDDLRRVAVMLNARPRPTLDLDTP